MGKLGELGALVSLAQVPRIHLDLWQAQNVYYELSQVILREQLMQVSRRWVDLFQKLGELLGVAIGEPLLTRLSASPALEPAHPVSAFAQEALAAAASQAAVMSLDGLQMPAGLV
jgi:hypothetical protein